MKKLRDFFLVVLSILLVVPSVQAGFAITQITDNDIQDRYPSLYKGTIAWQADNNHSGYGEITYWDGTNTIKITDDYYYDTRPSLYDGTIAWQRSDYRDNNVHGIFYWDGTNITQVSDNSNDLPPSLYDGTIAWPQQLYLYFWDGTSTTMVKDDLEDRLSYSLYNGTIMWAETDSYGYSSLYRWDGSSTEMFSSGYNSTMRELSLSEGGIAYRYYNAYSHLWGIHHLDLTTRLETFCYHNGYDNKTPSAYNGTIAWAGRDSGGDWEIFYWDGTNVMQVTNNDVEDIAPSLYNGAIAWQGFDGTDYEIYYAVYDDTEPDTQITDGPLGTVIVNDVTFTYTGTDDVSANESLTYSYRLEGHDDTWSEYTSSTSKSYTDLPDGTYTFSVMAKDQADNVDSMPASSSFTVSVQTQDGDGQDVDVPTQDEDGQDKGGSSCFIDTSVSGFRKRTGSDSDH